MKKNPTTLQEWREDLQKYCTNAEYILKTYDTDERLQDFLDKSSHMDRMNEDKYRFLLLPKPSVPEAVWCQVDEDIADFIQDLNQKGFRTNFSCAGHLIDEKGDEPDSFTIFYVSFDRSKLTAIRASDVYRMYPALDRAVRERENIRGVELDVRREDFTYRVRYRRSAKETELPYIMSEIRRILRLDYLSNTDEDYDEINMNRMGKRLSFLLRHDRSYQFDNMGYREVKDLIEHHGFTEKLLKDIVETNDKQRYEYNEDKTKIRARQGHSIGVDVGLEEMVPPAILYHGTASRLILSIRKIGIDKMKRILVHLSTNYETAEGVGRRHGRPVVLEVEAKRMYDDGYKFFYSNNGVWMTDKVPVEYIKNLYDVDDKE